MPSPFRSAKRVKQAFALVFVCLAMLAGTPAPADPASALTQVRRLEAIIGKSTVIRLPAPAVRVSIADPAIADVVLLGPQEVYVLGKAVGNTNLTTWSKGGIAQAIDLSVSLDAASVEGKVRRLVRGAENVQVTAAGTALVLSGVVSDALKVQEALDIAQSFGAKRIVNMLRVSDAQQVMLEVKVAEISRTLLDKLGTEFRFEGTSGGTRIGILSQLLTGADSLLFGIRSESKLVALDAEKRDSLVRILAEPTILAISGQEGSFLAGGRIFIPIPQGASSSGVAQYVLHEKEFGVRLRFLPTVLEGGKIHLKVAPEVSEVSAAGIRVTASGVPPSVIPAITTREVSTTVQLHDGESLAIGGLIKNNATANVKALPILGEIPILGALFRSTEFQSDRTELLFIVTPRLAAPGKRDYPLPTDAHRDPSRQDLYLRGRIEATAPVNRRGGLHMALELSDGGKGGSEPLPSETQHSASVGLQHTTPPSEPPMTMRHDVPRSDPALAQQDPARIQLDMIDRGDAEPAIGRAPAWIPQ
jgi:pilus assembly protein CpaC